MAKARSATTTDDPALMALMRAIVDHDDTAIAKLLAQSPRLATSVLGVGAARASADSYYFPTIQHYVYAGDTALHVAAAAYHLSAARDLIALGASVRARNRRGAEPLHYAADGGPTFATWNPQNQQDVTAYLIAAGADPNALADGGVAPLHRAARNRCTGAVRALLLGGADAHLKNKSGSTPIDLAAIASGRGGTGSAAAKREQAQILDLLRVSSVPH